MAVTTTPSISQVEQGRTWHVMLGHNLPSLAIPVEDPHIRKARRYLQGAQRGGQASHDIKIPGQVYGMKRSKLVSTGLSLVQSCDSRLPADAGLEAQPAGLAMTCTCSSLRHTTHLQN